MPVEIVSGSGKQGEAGSLLGDLIEVADGVRVWCRSYLGPDAGGVSRPAPRAAGLRRRIPPRPCGAGKLRAGQYFHNLVFVGVGVGGVLLSDGAAPASVLPGPSRGWEDRGLSRPWPWSRPGLGLLRGEWVPDSAVPGTGVMEVGGVSIAPARRVFPGHAQPVQQLPRRVPVELNPGAPDGCASSFGVFLPRRFPRVREAGRRGSD